MDSAPLRRGAPSAHEVWGNSVAILVGDLLFARASQLVAELGPKAVRIQADAFERLVLGQLNETLGPREGEDPIEHYLGVLADKTGSLIAASAHYGALFSGAPQPAVDAAVEYAEKVGVAFQLADDVIDLVSDADTTGKTPGTDLREGVATTPLPTSSKSSPHTPCSRRPGTWRANAQRTRWPNSPSFPKAPRGARWSSSPTCSWTASPEPARG